MPRIAGIDVPGNKQIWVSLTYIHGIGSYLSKQILKETQITEDVMAKELTEDELSRINTVIDRNYVIEGQLRRQTGQNIVRLKDITCYRGLRHRRGLPVRGQSTRSNGRTRKGPRKTVAGKKGVKEMRS